MAQLADQFRGAGRRRFSTWLYRIAYTQFLKAANRRKIGTEYGGRVD